MKVSNPAKAYLDTVIREMNCLLAEGNRVKSLEKIADAIEFMADIITDEAEVHPLRLIIQEITNTVTQDGAREMFAYLVRESVKYTDAEDYIAEGLEVRNTHLEILISIEAEEADHAEENPDTDQVRFRDSLYYL